MPATNHREIAAELMAKFGATSIAVMDDVDVIAVAQVHATLAVAAEIRRATDFKAMDMKIRH